LKAEKQERHIQTQYKVAEHRHVLLLFQY